MVTVRTPLKGLMDARWARALDSQRGVRTVGDLLWFLPRRYLDRRGDVAELRDGDYAVVIGEVIRSATRSMRSRRGSMLNVTIRTSTGDLDLTFFRTWGHKDKLVVGAVGLFAGKVSSYQGRRQLAHPSYEILAAEGGPGAGTPDYDHAVAMRPLHSVYPEVDGVDSWSLSGFLATVLPTVGGAAGDARDPADAGDPVPAWLRERRGLPTFLEAMRCVHLPQSWSETHWGKKRLKYDEALVMQLVLRMRRREHQAAPAVPRQPRPGGLLAEFDSRLPFPLTAGQRAVGEEIAADLACPHPMHRLLQGEVGSGKTIVAVRAMLAVIDAGGQAALLAPTEVLAAQHQRSITGMLGELAEGGLLGGSGDLDRGTRVALLTGSQSTAARRRALAQAASGEAGIVIGTHALIQDHVQLADLGLVVVDEQHRFGVEQRDALRGKAAHPPHVLVMTATPIPRTVAMTVFGDMATSVLAELPPGRSTITSHVVDNPRWYQRAWDRVAEEVAAGHQGYVVCPRIGDEKDEGDSGIGEAPSAAAGSSRGASEGALTGLTTGPTEGRRSEGPAAGDLFEAPAPGGSGTWRGVLEVLAELRQRPELAGCRIEMLHGRLSPDDKDAVMSAFAAGEIDVLVATTVIEVGVDVPNATVMVVLDADRFGVSQLHQLRGRIGRGDAPGLCLFVAQGAHELDRRPDVRGPGADDTAGDRLRAVAATTDGFELARLDLETRREGDILGARQSGGTSLRLLTVRGKDDEQIIEDARQDAADLLDADPQLAGSPELARLVGELLDEERAAFLERG